MAYRRRHRRLAGPLGRALAACPFAAAIALGTVGASCDSSKDEQVDSAGAGSTPGDEEAPSPSPEPVDEIPGVDVSELTVQEKQVWLSLANDALAPCGQGPATSVARCAQGADACATRCVGAAKYLARLVREGYEQGDIAASYRARYGPDGAVDLDLDDAPIRGAPMARITIAEFSDFECPFCGRAYPILEEIVSEFRGEVKLAFLHFPLSMHPRAAEAARATVAAQNQGKFWKMHDMIFEHQQALERSDLESYAEAVGLDMARFRRDLDAPETQRRVEQDRAQGERVGVDSTPTLFIDGRRYTESIESLGAYLREELAR